jgi:hypothetical protein
MENGYKSCNAKPFMRLQFFVLSTNLTHQTRTQALLRNAQWPRIWCCTHWTRHWWNVSCVDYHKRSAKLIDVPSSFYGMVVMQGTFYFRSYRSDPLWLKLSVRLPYLGCSYICTEFCFLSGRIALSPRYNSPLFLHPHDVLLSYHEFRKCFGCG